MLDSHTNTDSKIAFHLSLLTDATKALEDASIFSQNRDFSAISHVLIHAAEKRKGENTNLAANG